MNLFASEIVHTVQVNYSHEFVWLHFACAFMKLVSGVLMPTHRHPGLQSQPRGRLLVLADRIEARWIAAFEGVFRRCKAEPGLPVALLAESQSRALNLDLAELALLRLGCRPFRLTVPTPAQTAPVPVPEPASMAAIGLGLSGFVARRRKK
jgi:hypothetical protein